MAFRHWQGTPQVQAVAWRCPTCNHENTGRLEDGCVACKAGVEPAPQQRYSAFDQWIVSTWSGLLPTDMAEAMKKAWDAGVAWAQQQAGTQPVPQGEATDEGWTMQLTRDGAVDIPMNARAHLTICSALAAYRDNYLAYGGIPGQLSAQEVTELIGKLTPKDGI